MRLKSFLSCALIACLSVLISCNNSEEVRTYREKIHGCFVLSSSLAKTICDVYDKYGSAEADGVNEEIDSVVNVFRENTVIEVMENYLNDAGRHMPKDDEYARDSYESAKAMFELATKNNKYNNNFSCQFGDILLNYSILSDKYDKDFPSTAIDKQKTEEEAFKYVELLDKAKKGR